METKTQSVVLIPQEQFSEVLEKLTRIEGLILGDARQEVSEEWLKSEDARRMLGISPKTWQNWRKSKVIPFTQFMRNIWVKRSDIEQFLKSNSIKGRN